MSGSNLAGLGSTPEISAKLRDKLDNLAKSRIDPSLIEFPKDARQFEGGQATVSHAFLVSSSNIGRRLGRCVNPGGGHRPRGNASAPKAIAVKKFKLENESNGERVLRLALREARFLIEMSHKNIIKLEGLVEDLRKNRIWLILPWEDNGNLKDFVASKNWEIPERISLINDVASGVDHLHTRTPPIYHGDLKSLNVLVSSKYHAVIIDFGSARRLPKRSKDRDTSVTPTPKTEPQPALDFKATLDPSNNSITITGNKYTLRWAAPELLLHDDPGLWSDIWSLGWICYEVMTNSLPFENVQKDSVVVNQVIHGDLPSVTDHVRMSLIVQLSSIITKCWSIEPSNRPTAESFRKLMSWMPTITPDPKRTPDTAVSEARSAELLMKLGHMYASQDDYPRASSFYTKALDMYIKVVDNVGRATALLGLANLHRYQSEYTEAVRLYSEAAQIYTRINDKRRKVAVMLGLAEVHRGQNQYNQAIAVYSQALQICRDVGNKQGKVEALLGLAEVRRTQNEHAKAATSYTEALQICTDNGNRKWRSYALCGLADVYRAQRKYGEAIKLHSEALQIRTEVGDRNGRAYSLWGLAEVHRAQHEYSTAVTFLSEAIQILTDIGNRRDRANALLSLANTHRDQDHHRDAACLYEQAAEAFHQLGSSREAVEASACAAHNALTASASGI